LTEDFIDAVGSNGVAAVNLAVDCVEEISGMPKNLVKIEPQFKYLVKQQEKYGYLVFFNINITRKNMEDVKRLTEIAHEYKIGTDYHIVEPPREEENHYQHHGNDFYITQDYWKETDELLDWLIDKNKHGYPMVNSITHLQSMKKFMRGETEPWQCRAGINSSFIRTDGSLSPCFGLYSLNHDWGRIGDSKFDLQALETQKKKCNHYCLSTCQYNVGHYYTISSGILKWAFKHVRTGGLKAFE
jgi:MoaA/NifB/PqqE/SkfB family radical SAM enzyme